MVPSPRSRRRAGPRESLHDPYSSERGRKPEEKEPAASAAERADGLGRKLKRNATYVHDLRLSLKVPVTSRTAERDGDMHRIGRGDRHGSEPRTVFARGLSAR